LPGTRRSAIIRTGGMWPILLDETGSWGLTNRTLVHQSRYLNRNFKSRGRCV
jgi:hypothetical protein